MLWPSRRGYRLRDHHRGRSRRFAELLEATAGDRGDAAGRGGMRDNGYRLALRRGSRDVAARPRTASSRAAPAERIGARNAALGRLVDDLRRDSTIARHSSRRRTHQRWVTPTSRDAVEPPLTATLGRRHGSWPGDRAGRRSRDRENRRSPTPRIGQRLLARDLETEANGDAEGLTPTRSTGLPPADADHTRALHGRSNALQASGAAATATDAGPEKRPLRRPGGLARSTPAG